MKRRALIKINYNCNNNCIFCHSYDYKKKQKNFSILEKIKKSQEIGIKSIVLSGGEPTINKDIFKIIFEIKKRGMQHGFISNGRMFSFKEFLNKSIHFGGEYFYISLHSHKKEAHDLITMSQNSWQQTVQGIKNIINRREKVDLTINCVVIKDNVNNLEIFSKFLIELGVKKIKFSFPIIKGNMKRNVNFLSNIIYASKKISEAIFFCEERGIIAFYENIPCCFMNKKLRSFSDNLNSNFSDISECFESDFNEGYNSGKIYKKNKICLQCSYESICSGYFFKDEYIFKKINKIKN
jgi:MoaA/NifB/PqqE/SkfB family radical SAM enzyme